MTKYTGVVCGVLFAIGTMVHGASADEIPIQVSPNTINLDQKGVWVTVHADIAYADVVEAQAVLDLDGVSVCYIKSDAQGNLVAKFNVDDVKNIVTVPSARLTLTGEVETASGAVVLFSGTDTVRVVDNDGKR